MIKPVTTLTSFALEHLPKATFETQREVYLALADLAPEQSERARYNKMAESAAEQIAHQQAHAAAHEQLALDFRRGAL